MCILRRFECETKTEGREAPAVLSARLCWLCGVLADFFFDFGFD
jgi:hypothetical protein